MKYTADAQQIHYWAHMLDESMRDKTEVAESIEGMSGIITDRMVRKAESEPDTLPTLDDVKKGNRWRICRTPDTLPSGIPDTLRLADCTMVKRYSNGPFTYGGIWMQDYRAEGGATLRVAFMPKDVTPARIYNMNPVHSGTDYEKIADRVSAERAAAAVRICAGYVITDEVARLIISRLLAPDGATNVKNHVNRAKQREEQWLKKTLSDIELDRKFGTVTIPAEWTDPEYDRFIRLCDRIFGGSVYETFVPDETTEIEGEQRDVDDWDVYTVHLQNTIDEDEFWEKLTDAISENFEPGEEVKASILFHSICNHGERIAEKALDNYETDDDELTWRAHKHYGGYYPNF